MLKLERKLEWKRNCPNCGKELLYGCKGTFVRHRKLNSLCCSCSAQKLKNGKNSTHRRLPLGEAAFNELYKQYRWSAKKRGRDFNLSKEQAKVLFKGKCFYCGCEPRQIKTMPGCYGEFIYNGIDRKNNNVGYEIYNVVSSCGICNFAKDKHSTEEFIKWIRMVNENTKNIVF
jgi:hypothetical protein